MYLAEKQKQDAKIFKELIAFASTLILKDQSSADQHESYKSIMYANSYISAIEKTLPVVNGTPQFTSSELREYNAIPNNTEYFIDCYRRNSLYIADNEKRLKEVSQSAFNTNYSDITAPYRGNVYEVNMYYRMLYCKYGCDPYDARRAQDMSIIAYNVNSVTNNIDLFRFNKIYDECRNLFIERLFNKAFEYTTSYRELVNFLLVTMTVIRYMDEKLNDLIVYKNYTSKDLRNLFYSFGFFNDSVIPASFKEDVARSLYKLINAKATDEAFRIVVDDIFKSESIKLSKYVLVKDIRQTDYASSYFDGTPAPALNPDQVNLYFYKIPYDVVDSAAYINANADSLTPLKFKDVLSEDRFWYPEAWEWVDGRWVVNDDAEAEVERKLKVDTEFTVLETKYLSVTYKNDDLVGSAEKLALFFAMLHHVTAPYLIVESPTMKGNVPLFDLLTAFVYTRAILITKLNPANIAVGNCYSTNPFQNNREFKHFLMMLNTVINSGSDSDILSLFEFPERKVTNIIRPDPTEADPASRSASVICAVEDSAGKATEAFPNRGDITNAVRSIPDLIDLYRYVCNYIDDLNFAVKHVEQGLEYYSADFVTKDNTGNLQIDYNILSNDIANFPLFMVHDIDRLDYDIVRVLASGDPSHELVKNKVGEGALAIYYNRLKTYGLNNYFEFKNTQHIKEALVSSEDNISNENYGGEDTYEKYLKENQPEFAASVLRIIEESDDPLPEIEMISSKLAAEIDSVFRKSEFNDVSFASLNSLAVAAFATSIISFIKSITLQIKSSNDSVLEVEINEGGEDKMTVMDSLSYESLQHRYIFDGTNFEDAIDAVTGFLTLKDSPHLHLRERGNNCYFKDFNPEEMETDDILSIVAGAPLNKPEQLAIQDIEDGGDADELGSYLQFKEEIFAHVVMASGIQPDEYDFNYILYKEASFDSFRVINERFPLRNGEGFLKPMARVTYLLKVDPSGTVLQTGNGPVLLALKTENRIIE